MDKIIEDDELGRLVIRVNSRARSLVFRTKSDAVYVSVPPGITLKEVKQAIENLRGKLLASRQKIARPLIDLNYKIDAELRINLIIQINQRTSDFLPGGQKFSTQILDGLFHFFQGNTGRN